MRHIGFSGGAHIVELGTVDDVVFFFKCVKKFTKWKCPGKNWYLLTDRLYKRYIKQEEVGAATEQMRQVQQIFIDIPSSSVEWNELILMGSERSKLNPKLPMLSDVFSRYFSAFFECIESANAMYEEFKSYPGYQYQPLKIIITDMPLYIDFECMPLEQYDSLGPDDPPFWLR